MKGLEISFIWKIIVPIITFVVIAAIIVSVFGGEKEKSFLNLPKGVWISLSSADTKTFVLPPVVWFGKKLNLDGSIDFGRVFKEGESTEFIFPTNNIYIEKPSKAEALFALKLILFSSPEIGVLQKLTGIFGDINIIYKFKTEKPVLPTIAFYPLVTDDFGSERAPAECNSDFSSDICYLNPKKSFGKINLTLTLDFDKFYVEGKSFKKEENFIEDNVNLSVEYSTDKNPDGINYFDELGKTKKLGELINSGECKKDSKLKYKCSFIFNVADECCPTYVNIKPILKINLEDKKGFSWFETLNIKPISFLIVYYLDVLEDRDFIFEKFVEGGEGIQDRLFYDETNNKPGPVKDILIYPCRAKVANIDSLSVKDKENEKIDWSECKGSTNYVNLSSGWFCKDASAKGYYIYNPYAFCKLDKDKLPGIPKPVYLEGIIPSTDFTKKWDVPNIPIFASPRVPEEGWGFYLIRLPDIPHGEYKESAWWWAVYMIKQSINILSPGGSGKDISFPENIPLDGVNIIFDFGEGTTTPEEEIIIPPEEVIATKVYLSTNRAIIFADGASNSIITVQLKNDDGNNIAKSGVEIKFETTAGSLSATSATTDASGKTSVTLTSSTTSGKETITASSTGLTTDTIVISFKQGLCSKTGAKYYPTDTVCEDIWHNPGDEFISPWCNLYEVCHPELDYIIDDAIDCCDETPIPGIACDFANANSGGNNKKCKGLYIIKAFGPEAKYMQDYAEFKLCCISNKECNDPIYYGKCKPAVGNVANVNQMYCDPSGEVTDKVWYSDTDMTQNNCRYGFIPVHASINHLSTGICMEYAEAITTMIRKAGYLENEIYKVSGEGHAYNLILLPGDSKYHFVDTTGNCISDINIGGLPLGYDYCQKTDYEDCKNDNYFKTRCPDKLMIYGCSE